MNTGTGRFKPILGVARRLLPLITVASLVFVGLVAFRNLSALADLRPTAMSLLITGLSAAVYGAALLLVAENWHRMLMIAGGDGLARGPSYRVFTDTQLAKYLPGNVAHVLARHVRLKDDQRTHGMLFRAFVFETVMIVGMAAVTAALIWIVFGKPLALTGWGSWASIAAWVVLGCAVVSFAAMMIRKAGQSAIALLAGAGLILFFSISGGVFFAICLTFDPQASAGLAALAIAAWIAGFVVPGAPGGLGPREAALLALAAPSLGEPTALAAIALYRVSTMLGDVVCFAIGRLFFRAT